MKLTELKPSAHRSVRATVWFHDNTVVVRSGIIVPPREWAGSWAVAWLGGRDYPKSPSIPYGMLKAGPDTEQALLRELSLRERSAVRSVSWEYLSQNKNFHSQALFWFVLKQYASLIGTTTVKLCDVLGLPTGYLRGDDPPSWFEGYLPIGRDEARELEKSSGPIPGSIWTDPLWVRYWNKQLTDLEAAHRQLRKVNPSDLETVSMHLRLFHDHWCQNLEAFYAEVKRRREEACTTW